MVERRLRVVNGGAVSDTVLQRMDLTEEFLEKTITLREDPVLTITNGAGTGHIFSLNRQTATSIGRAKANDIALEDVSVSSEHCRIRPEEGAFILHDLKSTNGTFVNERRVSRHTLAEGDTIKCGETYLQFRLNQRRD
jgi:pSer/pThr/pTyr-binding forkhead associated (FHA) protein